MPVAPQTRKRHARLVPGLWMLLLLVGAMLWVDRPLALLCFRLFGHTGLRAELDGGLLLLFVVPLVLPLLILRPRLSVLAALAAVASWAVNLAARSLIGRSRPDPLFLYAHQYGFHLGHPSLWWCSFPSGTAAVYLAYVAVIVRAEPTLRLPASLLAGGLGLALVLANAHWLSDVLAGALLGLLIGSLLHTRLVRSIRLPPACV